jgi:hypothetical protein
MLTFLHLFPSQAPKAGRRGLRHVHYDPDGRLEQLSLETFPTQEGFGEALQESIRPHQISILRKRTHQFSTKERETLGGTAWGRASDAGGLGAGEPDNSTLSQKLFTPFHP